MHMYNIISIGLLFLCPDTADTHHNLSIGTVPLKGKLPPSRETRLVSRETRLERNETSLERNETSLVSRECTGSINISHSSVFEIRIKMSVSYRFDYRGRRPSYCFIHHGIHRPNLFCSSQTSLHVTFGDGKENYEKKMAAQTLGGEKHVKGLTIKP